jgi:hypothetical protein
MSETVGTSTSTPPRRRSSDASRIGARWRTAAAVAASLAAVSAGFLVAPILLLRINEPVSDSDLSRMSDAGQAYGGLSALLSAVATIAVATALLMQIQQIRISRAQGARMMQLQLMNMLIEHPEVRPVSPGLHGIPTGQRSRDIYTNLVLRYLEMAYEIGYLPAETIRTELRMQFTVDDIRRFWERTRPIQLTSVHSKARRRFIQLVEGAYEEAVAAGPAAPTTPAVEAASPEPAQPTAVDYRRRLHDVAVGVLLAMAARQLWRNRR